MMGNFFNCVKVLFLVIPGLSAMLCAGAETPSRMDLLDDSRTMKVGDYVLYQVLEEREAPEVVFVNDRGEIDLPLVKGVPAVGKTCRAFAFEVKERLEETFFYQATVLVRFQYADNSRGRVNLVGRVARPGPLDIPADEIMTVSSAVTRAGSVLPGADLSRVELVRDNPTDADEEERLIVDVRDVLENGNLSADQIVRPNDIIIVPEARSAGGKFYVTGMVSREGVYNLPADGSALTVSEAILNAGGFQPYADKDAVELVRAAEEDEGAKRLKVDVEAILEGRKPGSDPAVEPGDIIHVKEVFFSW